MRKLKLGIEELAVETFDTTPGMLRDAAGTVEGFGSYDGDTCIGPSCRRCPTAGCTGNCGATVDATCPNTCAYTCDDLTCLVTCPDTCDDAWCQPPSAQTECGGLCCWDSCGGTCPV